MKYLLTALLLFTMPFSEASLQAEDHKAPNIVWISAEDISSHFGCYGDPHAITPHIDQLATEGTRYTHAFTTAGVCAPCRSGIITGMYQTTLGTQHMRGQAKLPNFIKPFPLYLRQAGYYCTNNSKQDYQFKPPKETWDASSGKAHWRNRTDKSKPFFSVFNFTGCHESGIASESKYQTVTKNLTQEQRQDPDKLTTFPPYYPNSDIAREDWKRNYELITAMDAWAGDIIQQLKDDGLYEETIIFFWSDHGVGLPRAKRWLYDSGTRIPLVIRIPEKHRANDQGDPGSVSDQLISSIDFGPTVLNLAGLQIPEHVQGQPFLGGDLPQPRSYIYGARDRMDERYDIIRMVRNHRFQYIRNYEPLKTYYQYMNTPEGGATMAVLRKRHDAGKLNPIANAYFAPTKPVEELYDCEADPHEIRNLADDPQHVEILAELRNAHLAWVKETRDTGLVAEPILIEREKEIGHRYGILRGQNADAAADRLADTAALASSGPAALPELVEALSDDDSAVRYWGATGLGNIGKEAISASEDLKKTLLEDSSAVVQIASARALCRIGQPQPALPVLIKHLKNGEQWERLHAAIVLDEIDEQAKPVLQEMHQNMKPRKDLYANGKYVIRVLNRTLNQLEGTINQVP